MEMIKKYQESLQEIYDHVGFVEDWVVYPLDFQLDMFWSVDYNTVKYASTMEEFESDGDYYLDDIYTQRFYNKWVYEGKEFTLIFCDPHVDGLKWFRIFDNSKRVNL